MNSFVLHNHSASPSPILFPSFKPPKNPNWESCIWVDFWYKGKYSRIRNSTIFEYFQLPQIIFFFFNNYVTCVAGELRNPRRCKHCKPLPFGPLNYKPVNWIVLRPSQMYKKHNEVSIVQYFQINFWTTRSDPKNRKDKRSFNNS